MMPLSHHNNLILISGIRFCVRLIYIRKEEVAIMQDLLLFTCYKLSVLVSFSCSWLWLGTDTTRKDSRRSTETIL